MTETRTLLAFAPMINCEATRCVLEYYGLQYHEVDRLFGWVNIQTFFHGGYGEVPIYYGNGVRLSGPAPIVRRFDAERGLPRLLPPEEPLRTQINSEWLFFHNVLSSGVAPLAYYHLLPQTKAMAKAFGDPLSPLGRMLMPTIYPGFRWLLGTLLRLNPARIEDCKTRMLMILDRVDRRLSTHNYLVGDQISLADLGFISSSAPILVPDHYAKQLPPPEDWPPAFAQIVREARSRPCADYARGIYAEIAQRKKEAGEQTRMARR